MSKLISGCTMEMEVWYRSADEKPPRYNGVPDAETCQTYCECRNNAAFFHWNRSTKMCRCLNSNTGAVAHDDSVSGVAIGCKNSDCKNLGK